MLRYQLYFLPLVLTACGDPANTVSEFCQAQCSWDARCEVTEGSKETCLSGCEAWLGSKIEYRAEVLSTWGSCFEDLSCDESDEEVCSEKVAEVLSSDADAQALKQVCVAKFETCSLHDDACLFASMAAASARDALRTCFERSCEEVSSCLDNAIRGDAT